MAITTEMCNSFKTQLLTGVHNFTTSTGDVFKIALYTSTATLNKSTTVYSATNEAAVSGGSSNYSAGGFTLTNVTPTLSTDTAIVDFNDPTVITLSGGSASFTAAGCLIYNSSESNAAVSAHSFTEATASGDGATFTVTFPAAAAGTAIIRLA